MRVGKNTDSAIWMHRRRFPDCAGIKRNPYYRFDSDGHSDSVVNFVAAPVWVVRGGLNLPGRIGGPAEQLDLAGLLRRPAQAPVSPQAGRGVLLPLGVLPAVAAVGADFDLLNGAFAAGPGRAAEFEVVAGLDAGVRRGRENLRFDPHLRERHPHRRQVVLLFPAGIIHRLKVPLVGVVDDPDFGQPFYRRHAVPAGHDGPQRRAVGGGERLAVHLVGEQHVAQRPAQWQAA